jgi:hypothetical protein
MKPVRFVGSAKNELSAFPKAPRIRAGHELFMVQVGRDPDDWRSMPAIGPGACEIRVRDAAGAFRVIYVAKFTEAVYRPRQSRRMLRNSLSRRLLKKAQVQGGARCAERGVLGCTPQRARECANAADGPFSAAC